MSTSKIDCIFTLQNLLINRVTTLFASGDNLSAAQAFQNLVLTVTAAGLDGFYAQISQYYEPLTGTFLSKVQALNDLIQSGSATPADFTAYVKLLAASLQA